VGSLTKQDFRSLKFKTKQEYFKFNSEYGSCVENGIAKLKCYLCDRVRVLLIQTALLLLFIKPHRWVIRETRKDMKVSIHTWLYISSNTYIIVASSVSEV